MYGCESGVLQEYFPEHTVHSAHADQDRGRHSLEPMRRKGGIALIWNKRLDRHIEVHEGSSSRLQVVELTNQDVQPPPS